MSHRLLIALTLAAAFWGVGTTAEAQSTTTSTARFTLTINSDKDQTVFPRRLTLTHAVARGFASLYDGDSDGRPDSLTVYIVDTNGRVNDFTSTDFTLTTYTSDGNGRRALKPGTYSRAADGSGGITGNYMNAWYGSSTCSDTGQFSISRLEYELVGTFSKTFHITNLGVSLTTACSQTGPRARITVAYSDAAQGTGSTPEGPTPSDGNPPTTPTTPTTPTSPSGGTELALTLDQAVYDNIPAVTHDSDAKTKVTVSTIEDFEGDVDLVAWSEPEGLDVSVNPGMILSPGRGEATVTVSLQDDAVPRDYVVNVMATANDKSYPTSFIVNVPCEVPAFLGAGQPQGATIARGTTARLEARPSGSGPFRYQWYSGQSGMTFTPIENATNATFTTPALNQTSVYWVRVSNACGAADSQSVNVFVP